MNNNNNTDPQAVPFFPYWSDCLGPELPFYRLLGCWVFSPRKLHTQHECKRGETSGQLVTIYPLAGTRPLATATTYRSRPEDPSVHSAD